MRDRAHGVGATGASSAAQQQQALHWVRAKIAAALASTSYGALAGGAVDLRQVHLSGSLRTGNLEPRHVMPEPQIRVVERQTYEL